MKETINNSQCYRIVTDNCLGYEVQKKQKFLFFSWWKQLGHVHMNTNSFKTINEAKDWINNGCKRKNNKVKVVWTGLHQNIVKTHEETEEKQKTECIDKDRMRHMRQHATNVFELTKGFTGEPTDNAMKAALEMAGYVLELTNEKQ